MIAEVTTLFGVRDLRIEMMVYIAYAARTVKHPSSKLLTGGRFDVTAHIPQRNEATQADIKYASSILKIIWEVIVYARNKVERRMSVLYITNKA